jgi:hypothetical protein
MVTVDGGELWITTGYMRLQIDVRQKEKAYGSVVHSATGMS